jgi:hypothetical protein
MQNLTGPSKLESVIVSVAFVILLVAGRAAASDDVRSPDDPVAKAAFEVLDRSCARCHQEGRLVGRDRPASGFGNILKLDEIGKNRALIVPGNPYGSYLFKRIVDREMPYDVMMEGANAPSPNEADIKTLETWINSLAEQTATCETRKFVTNKDVVALIATDLENLPRTRANATRYLTLTHLTNICTDPEALKVYAQGAIKLVNSLSRSSDVVRLETIDPEHSILRINLNDIGWQPSDWDVILANDPYAMLPDTQLMNLLEGTTGTKLPYVRADWFAFAASRPPLYNRLLKLPSSFRQLAEAEGVSVDDDIRRFLAKRAGFQKSGVSANNRLIERHAAHNGYFWTSYDFAGNRQKQNLFEFPLGPGGPGGFDPDGGETIFSLPNGFQAYFLNNAKGDPLDKGPTTIVRDLSRKDLAVTNGISCMGCHDQGMRKAKDDVRASVLGGRTFSKDVKDAVAALHPVPDVMDGIIEEDGKRFAGAMTRARLDPKLKLNGVEMINALAKRYEDDVDGTLAAAELGLAKDEFSKAANDSDKRLKPLLRRLEQGLVPRDQFETTFKDIAKDITDDQPVNVAGVDDKDTAAKPAPRASLSVTSDKDFYRQGDTPKFTVLSNADCFLTLTNVDEKGQGTVLFPNKFQQENSIKANAELQFPPPGAPFQYRMRDKGFETVIVVCTEQATDVDGIKHDFGKSAFTIVDNYTRSVTRSIAIEEKEATGGAASPPKPRADAGREILRPAIKAKNTTGGAASPPKPGADAGREISRAAIKVEVR